MTARRERARGVMVRRLDLSAFLAEATETIRDVKRAEQKPGWATYEVRLGFEPYALGEGPDGTAYVICQEGVGWEVSNDQPLDVGLYVSQPGFMSIMPSYEATVADLDGIREIATGPVVDLADHVRAFGDRLEANFWLWHRRLTTRKDAAVLS